MNILSQIIKEVDEWMDANPDHNLVSLSLQDVKDQGLIFVNIGYKENSKQIFITTFYTDKEDLFEFLTTKKDKVAKMVIDYMKK